MIDCEHVDAAAVVSQLPAGPTGRRIPARDGGSGADVGEPGDLALCCPAVARDEPVGAVRARDGCHAATGVIIALVVGHWDCISFVDCLRRVSM